MFTGLIETKGTVAGLQKHPGGARFSVRADQFELTLGESIAVNGACVTVVEVNEGTFTVDLVPETLSRTNLGLLQVGHEVNLERAMAVGDRFGGHWVQGHIDCLGQVRSRRKVGNEELLEVTIPFEVGRFIVPQGSVTIDGVSLTVVEAEKDRLKVALIPFTRELTTLGASQPMDVVNIELDIVSKYLDRHIGAYLARIPRVAEEAVQRREPVSRADVTKQRVPMSRAATAGPRAERKDFDRKERPRSDRRDQNRSDRRAGKRPEGKTRIKWNDEPAGSRPARSRGSEDRPPKRTSKDRPSRARSTGSAGSRTGSSSRSRSTGSGGSRATASSNGRSRSDAPKYARPSRAKSEGGSAAKRSSRMTSSAAKRSTTKRTTAASKGTKRATARVTKSAKRTTKTTRSPKRK